MVADQIRERNLWYYCALSTRLQRYRH